MSPDPTLLSPNEEPTLLGHMSGPNTLRSGEGLKFLRSNKDPSLLSPASVPTTLGSCVRNQFSWVSRPNPTLLGRASRPKSFRSGHELNSHEPNSLEFGPKSHEPISWVGHTSEPKFLGSCIRTQLSWVWTRTPVSWVRTRTQLSWVGHASWHKSLGSCVQTLWSWVQRLDPTNLGHNAGPKRN